MNKKGFTLQEALVTIAIIGVIAAITIPGLAKMMPNRDKNMVLKAHAALTDLTNQMLVDPALYWYNSDGQGCDGLSCNTEPVEGSVPDQLYNLIHGNNLNWVGKYAAILAYNMHTQQGLGRSDADVYNFQTTDGVVWVFQEATMDNGETCIQVAIDTDGNLPEDHLQFFDNEGNQPADPNYAFAVTADGNVTPGDRLTISFINDPTQNVAKKDFAEVANSVPPRTVVFSPEQTTTPHIIDNLQMFGKEETTCNGGQLGICTRP